MRFAKQTVFYSYENSSTRRKDSCIPESISIPRAEFMPLQAEFMPLQAEFMPLQAELLLSDG
jgi:hypothetical protein